MITPISVLDRSLWRSGKGSVREIVRAATSVRVLVRGFAALDVNVV